MCLIAGLVSWQGERSRPHFPEGGIGAIQKQALRRRSDADGCWTEQLMRQLLKLKRQLAIPHIDIDCGIEGCDDADAIIWALIYKPFDIGFGLMPGIEFPILVDGVF